MTKETLNSVIEWLNFRSTTSLIGTYVGFYVTYHWEVFYTTLFVSEKLIDQKFHLLKNEYIKRYFLNWHGLDDWPFYWGIIIPGLFAFLFIWVMPKILFIHSFNQERDYKLKKKMRIAKDEHVLLLEKEKIAKSNKKIVEAELETVKAENEIIQLDPNKQNEEEYTRFLKKHPSGNALLRRVKDAYYDTSGYYKRYFNRNNWHEPLTDADDIAIADSYGLVEIEGDQFRLTEKGKYFLRQAL